MSPESALGFARQRQRLAMYLAVLLSLLLVSLTLAITLGPVRISPQQAWLITAHEIGVRLGMEMQPGDWTSAQFQIVWRVRMPRVLLAALVGAGLALVGVAMQAMVRNPLADPYLLGVSSGASVGAVSVIAFGALAFAGDLALPLGAFGGALAACIAVYFLAHAHGRLISIRLVLGGVAIAYALSGVTSLIVLTTDQRELANSVLTWTLGSLAGTRWDELGLPAVLLVIGAALLLTQARSLNALLSGEESAATLGVDTTRTRRWLFVLVSLVTGVLVSLAGPIGFVGLIVPHVTRMLVGAEHRSVLPVSALAGAIFLVWVDVFSRITFAPAEVPVGVITSLLGGPFFVWMLCRKSARERLIA
ncbi:iron ABC transporter permease [Diaphorobacter ruginosibacter]|uniref:Iron ABC transporter permease n=1 Tax=Diaphorobacter ruginosibacter TaxID=1715720 RepID=A0A7G9RIB9_9BURK|nr:iron ABC transporter permease [Diaphorobacter ruginosibacter]QNN55344.1 iron ABC transporter permease [Diaphorobacter ruginosibacter]